MGARSESDGREIVVLERESIRGCRSAIFVPVLEHIREAARFQIQFDAYEAALIDIERRASGQSYLQIRTNFMSAVTEGVNGDGSTVFKKRGTGRGLTLSDVEVLLSSLLRAINESPSLGEDFNSFMSSCIEVVERIGTTAMPASEDGIGGGGESEEEEKGQGAEVGWTMPTAEDSVEDERASSVKETGSDDKHHRAADFSIMDDLLGVLTKDRMTSAANTGEKKDGKSLSSATTDPHSSSKSDVLHDPIVAREKRAFIVLGVLLRAVAIAKVNVGDRADIKIALTGVKETLLLIRTIIEVRQKNIAPLTRNLRRQMKKKLEEFINPIQRRFGYFGQKLLARIEREGEKNRVKISRFLEILLRDGRLIRAVDGERWEKCLSLLERAIVKARILDSKILAQYKQSAFLLYQALAPTSGGQRAAKRNGEKLAQIAKVLKLMLSPKRTFLKFIQREDVLEVLERIMVRVFSGASEASMMLNIYAFNFHNFRELILLRNQDIAGSFWERLLDAAHEEFEWGVTRMPEQMRDFGEPFSDLFLMGVCSLKRKRNGERGSWLNFLDDEKSIALINELELKVIDGIQLLCDDLKDMMEVMPYYATIDDDILNLLDAVELDKVLLESVDALVDKDRFFKFLREKSFAAIDRFLDYLPKLSIPVDKRELPGGWLLTCRGKGGGDLTLSEVNLSRENMVCKLIGSGNLLALDKCAVSGSPRESSKNPLSFDLIETDSKENVEVVSVLDDIRALLLNAENHGYWGVDVGDVEIRTNSSNVASTFLAGTPVSKVLNQALEKWAKKEIDDDELMEAAIRDVSYHIRIKEGLETVEKMDSNEESVDQQNVDDESSGQNSKTFVFSPSPCSSYDGDIRRAFFDNRGWHFNPKKDPTVLNLEINNLTGKLDQFLFRLEPKYRNNLFDPVFQGTATLTIKDTSIRLKVSCHKERLIKLGKELVVPVFQLQELDLNLNKVQLVFEETGVDWMLNKMVSGLSETIKESVESNLKNEMANMINDALEHFNSFVEVNSEATLKVLGIQLDDLKENIVWV